jgi:hypothetical protein
MRRNDPHQSARWIAFRIAHAGGGQFDSSVILPKMTA